MTTSNTVTETHIRTITKTVLYRICSTIMIMAIAKAFGASNGGAAGVGLTVLIMGAATYYLHDRAWLLFGWGRTDGKDSNARTIAKTIAYRIVILILSIFTSLVFISGSITTAIMYGVTSIPAYMVLYFVMEKIFNAISWGKVAK